MTIAYRDAPGAEAVVADTPPRPSVIRRSLPMVTFIGRRVLSSLVVLLGATFIVYMLLSYSLDFLEDLRFSTDPNAPAMIAQRIALLNLDSPPIVRYFMWLWGLIRGIFTPGAYALGTSWGTTFGQVPVWHLLSVAIPNTVSLVAGATVLAILFGILVGIVSALRQYTRFDYGVTFLSFVLFSLPSFWVAVLLKIWGAIGFNDFLAHPEFSWPTIIIVSLLLGGLWSAIIGGIGRTRWLVFLVGAVVTALIMVAITFTDWLINPTIGIPGILVLGLLVALALVALTVGFNPASRAPTFDEDPTPEPVIDNATDVDSTTDEAPSGLGAWMRANRALMAGITTAVVGAILYYPLQFAFTTAGWWRIVLLAAVAVVVGALIGWLWGGYDRRISMRVGALTALLQGMFIFLDRIAQIWAIYNRAPQINNRPISTIGSNTPGIANLFQNNFWFMNLDRFTHVLLPTLTLVLISFAGYTRYTRASMLEVMNQDYIRTARAKGLSERVVTIRHAFRNALIPLATIIPLDVAAIFGGAIITESIFGWPGMGTLFLSALSGREVEVVMGYFLVTGTLLVIGSIVVDFIYAALDPRIRVNA